MKVFNTQDKAFVEELDRIVHRKDRVPEEVENVVVGILDDVEKRGDDALFAYTQKFDGIVLSERTVEVSQDEIEAALKTVPPGDIDILDLSASRIRAFHERQRTESWSFIDDNGVELGQVIRPLSRVGIYAPGGRATYPSTVLMAAIPAQVAGVGEIILTSPATGGVMNPLLLVAAHLAGVDRVFKIGGAQAVAALAFGTQSVPRVDKIVGPGNAYVATAKRMVYGTVGIDMIAGPSEIVVIADMTARPEVVAADLLSQAEHDPMAGAVLLTPEGNLAGQVMSEVRRQLQELNNPVAAQALADYGAVIVTADTDEAVDIANQLAPEHLELMVTNPKDLLKRVANAGAVFLGHHTPEVLGDYIAGPNHILPTGGTARFSSPLGVYDFIKRMSVLSFSEEALGFYGPRTVRFAEVEGLEAHGRSITTRFRAGIAKKA